MRGYIGVTDGDWYRFLAGVPGLTEANFWQPGGSRVFRALAPGEPFLFKTHYPHNRLVGGGLYSGFARLRVSEAWELFREGNGAASKEEMLRRVSRYRSREATPTDDPVIGCVMLRDLVFLDEDYAPEPPLDFAPNIVQGKSYDIAELSSSPAEDFLRLLIGASTLMQEPTWHGGSGVMWGDPRLVAPRLGQRAFKAALLEVYEGHCAVTGHRIRPTLDAAHIRPVTQGGEHRLDNGLLLRSDIHTLYDRGYVGVDERLRLLVSPRLRSEFGNGDELYARAGTEIGTPSRRADRPNREALAWHLDSVFLAS